MSYLETLIAFVGVILLASLLVTIFNQFCVWVFDLRGKNLVWGLTLLFKTFDNGTEEKIKKVVQKILKQPMITSSKRRFASVIRLEQLKMIIEQHPDFLGDDEKPVWKKLQINKKEIEKWFDTVSDRMSERFLKYSRVVSILGGLLVAVAFQIDSIHMFQRINQDEVLKAQMVASSEIVLQQTDKILNSTQVYEQSMDALRNAIKPAELPSNPPLSDERSAKSWLAANTPQGITADEMADRYDKLLRNFKKEKLDTLNAQWLAVQKRLASTGSKIFTADYGWKKENWDKYKLLGILISVVLLSLGAPFWFNALKNLTGLRNRVMASEDAERAKRNEEGAEK